MYFGGGLNNIDVGLDDNGIGFEAKIGKVFYNNFGVEGQISKTFSPSEESVDNLTLKINTMAISAFATYSHHLTPQFTIMPKIGFSQYSMDASISTTNADDSSLGVALGVDIKYQITNDMNIYASYSQYYPKLNKYITNLYDDNGRYLDTLYFNEDTAPRHLSIGVEKKF